jgi:aspartyl-tRNA(Asn)/glutamyl-tRNA(Gln) amidotransferase subunit B
LPPVVLYDKFIARIEGEINEGPSQLRDKFSRLEVSSEVINDVINVRETARVVSRLLDRADPEIVRRIAFWLLKAQTELNVSTNYEIDTKKITVTDDMFIELSKLVGEGSLNSTAAMDVLWDMFKTGKHPREIAEYKNLIQESDESALIMIVEQVLSENVKAAEDIKNGELKAIGFLVGQVMKASKGKANPSVVTSLIKKQLGV